MCVCVCGGGGGGGGGSRLHHISGCGQAHRIHCIQFASRDTLM